jgi:predicted nuclease of predicted toxin-antitoxin system
LQPLTAVTLANTEIYPDPDFFLMGTLSAELAAHANRPDAPRVYADANMPAGVVTFMRHDLGWDVLFVVEHDDLRRAHDRRHFDLARQLARTLVTLDRDYLDDRRYPPAETGGVIVIWAPNEALLTRTLAAVHHQLFRAGHEPLPLVGQKLVADPSWMEALHP